MLESTKVLLEEAQQAQSAVAAFNIYNLEGALAVARAAEAENRPAILQIHPSALEYGGAALIALCQQIATDTHAPIGVHLDHCESGSTIEAALNSGVRSIMVDGSSLTYSDNIAFTSKQAERIRAVGGFVEAELGRLSGTEDGLTVAEFEARLTDPAQAADFVQRTGVDFLAVCIGNIHGIYHGEIHLDFERLAAIRAAVSIPLVLHGTSGLPKAILRKAISLGVVKFNINTALREVFVTSFRNSKGDELLPILRNCVDAMQQTAQEFIHDFA